MNRFVFIFLIFVAFNSFSQQDTFDQFKNKYDLLFKEAKHDSALFVAKQMNAWVLKNETDTSLRYPLSLKFVANCFIRLNNTDSAFYYLKLSLKKLEKQQRKAHSEFASSLNSLGVLYNQMGDYKAAEPLYKQALEIKKKELGENHPDYAKSLNNLGILYKNMGDYKSAEPLYKQALEIKKKELGENHPSYAASLSTLGELYAKMGDYKSAEPLYKQALEIKKKELGENHPDYAMSLNNLGNLHREMGDYKTAELLLKQALEIKKKELGENHPDYALSLFLNNLGALYKEMGDYKIAETLYKQALEIKKKELGEKHPDYAKSLNNLGELYFKMGYYKVAETLYKQSLEIKKNSMGEEHPSFAESLNNLGDLYKNMGDYNSAEPYYMKSLEIRKKALGENHPNYAESLNSLGVLYKNMGDYKAAEALYKQSLEIRKKAFGGNHPDVAKSLNNLGDLYNIMGDYKAAEFLYKQSLEIIKKVLGELHPSYASILNNLGILKKRIGDYKSAEVLIKQSLEIKKKEFGENHPSYATSLNNLGALYKEMCDYKSAEVLIKQSLEIKKKALGENHPSYAASLRTLGELYAKMGDYNSAEQLYKQTLEIKKKVLGEDHQDYLSNLNLYAYLLLLTNREQEAQNILSNNFSKKAKEIADNFEWLNDNQKDAYWKKESSFYDKLSWFANTTYEKVPEAVGLNYDASLVTKSKMLETKLSSDNFEQEREELKEQLIYRRRLLIKLESDGSDEIKKIKKLQKEVDSLDKRLTMSWPEYAQQKKNLSITWEQVQQNLEKGEAAIEFVRFKNEDDSLYYYNALIIRKEDKYPQLVKLCKEKDLEKIQPKLGFSTYYSLVWQPMEIVLKEVKTIYYAPIGLLNNVPFNAMYSNNHPSDEIVLTNESSRGSKTNKGQVKTPKNVVYLMDKYTLHQLNSTRYLAMGLKSKEKERFNNTMAMIGGVNYDFLPGSTNAFKKSKRNKDQSRSSSSAQQKLIYLEGTKFEIEQIDKKVTTSGWISTVLESNQATEENIIKLEGKEAKGILHIATHGYAFPEYDFNDTLIDKNSLQYSYRYSTNPMVRSGLILAGGNWAWTGSDTLSKLGAEQNGILTALEVSQLNLKKTKLVVLSACETGLGKIEGSEGTFGLKRGFKLAGVEQIIVSLWSVPDKETMELMTLFYSDLAKTLNPVISFEKAQKEMRINYPTEPEKWAGFVLVR